MLLEMKEGLGEVGKICKLTRGFFRCASISCFQVVTESVTRSPIELFWTAKNISQKSMSYLLTYLLTT